MKLTGGFGGTITSLPANTSKVLVNIDDATTANGLRVATTTIPAPLRTAVVLYSDTKSNLSPDDVVMTFPAGTTVDPSAFAVAFQQGASGTPESLGLVSVENADGTVSLSVTGDLRPGYWTGAAGDCKVSSAGNWSDGAPAAGAALDFSGVQPGTTIIGDTDLTYGAVTIGGKITFSGT